MPARSIQGGAFLGQDLRCTVRRGVRRAVVCMLFGAMPMLAAAAADTPAADAKAQSAPAGTSASDLQQRLQRLEQSQQELQRQLQQNAAEVQVAIGLPRLQPTRLAKALFSLGRLISILMKRSQN